MKTGKNLMELAAELTRIQTVKKDYAVPTSMLSMNDKGNLQFTNGSVQDLELNNHSTGQVATHADIPKAYFDRLQSENKSLLAQNVNHGFRRVTETRKAGQKPDQRLVRVLDNKVRGFLSSAYRILDGHDVLEAVLPHLLDKGFEVVSSEITDKRLYLKTTSKRITGEVKKNDVVQYGVMVSTSDVGAGSLRIEPYLTRLVCLNGMVASTSFKKAHLGRSQIENQVMEILSDNTKMLNDKAFYATLTDYLLNTMKPDVFDREINKMREASEIKIENFDLEKVVELSMNHVGVRGENTKKSILHALAEGNEGAGLTMYGLANSFTRAAQAEALDYDSATDLERAGGLILELEPGQWKKIAC